MHHKKNAECAWLKEYEDDSGEDKTERTSKGPSSLMRLGTEVKCSKSELTESYTQTKNYKKSNQRAEKLSNNTCPSIRPFEWFQSKNFLFKNNIIKLLILWDTHAAKRCLTRIEHTQMSQK